MTIRKYLISICFMAAVILAFWMLHPREVQGGASMTPPASTTVPDAGKKTPDAKHETPSAASPVSALPAASLRQRMDTAKDHFALAKEILPLARAGNPEAQLVLFQTYRGCTEGQMDHFKKYDTLEKMRQQAIENGVSVADEEKRFVRCQGFYTDEAKSLGDPWDWLQKATDAGYAPAQAETARLRLWQDRLKAQILAAGGADPAYIADPLTLRGPVGGDSTPRELLAAAAQSGDPAVFELIAREQFMLHPGQPSDVTQIESTAWTYAACQRGFDCSGYGPASMINCGPNDQNCTPVPNAFLKRVNNDWAPVQERVNQINAALAAKQWDKLPGLAPGG
jgi:hypothetical protein